MKPALFITVSLFLVSCTEIYPSKKLIEACADDKSLKHLDFQNELAIKYFEAGTITYEAAEGMIKYHNDQKKRLRNFFKLEGKFKMSNITNYSEHWDECEYEYEKSPKNFRNKWE
tara:strand:+ start:445 stop:789 length:345 start_codon:yes stop_codon:yes gene_type:complete